MSNARNGEESKYTMGQGSTLAKPASPPPKVDTLPPYRVLLHNDDMNELVYVIETVFSVCRMHKHRAVEISLEAHASGLALVTETHREHAELVREQLISRGLTITIEPAD